MHIFLDFDGVLCKSHLEGFVIAWLAANDLDPLSSIDDYVNAGHGSIPLWYFSLFSQHRSLLHSGYQMVMVLELYERWKREGRSFLKQEGFLSQEDREASSVEIERYISENSSQENTMINERLYNKLYEKRERFMTQALDRWLELHGSYDNVIDFLGKASSDSKVFILSTKKETLIEAILNSWQVKWPKDRIICSGSRKKSEIITELVTEKAIFLDDHISHLIGLPKTVKPYLASWGYVNQQSRKMAQDYNIESLNSIQDFEHILIDYDIRFN